MRVTLSLLLAPLLTTACTRTTDPVVLGRGAFVSFGCAACHAVGPGGPTTGTNLSHIGYTHSLEWLARWLKDPKAWKKDSVMPDPRLPADARENLVAYLSTLKGQGYQAGKPWDAAALRGDLVRRGEAVYNSVGCVGCHGAAGKGGFPNNNVPGGKIPALDKVKEGFSKEELARKLRIGVPRPQKDDPRGPEPMLNMPAWGKVLNDGEIDALVAYLFSISVESKTDW